MRAMILAAGRGERMRPLTDTCPKPLLRVHDEPLLVRLIRQLVAAGIADIVINHAWLGEQIEASIGNGSRWQARVHYSPETLALETAGGVAQARSLLGDEPFVLVNGDLFTDFDFALARQWREQIARSSLLGVCTLVANPPHHREGDFALSNGLLSNANHDRLTYAGIAVFAPAMFADLVPGTAAPLAPLLRAAADAGRLGGHAFTGQWSDVGTPERLAELNHAH